MLEKLLGKFGYFKVAAGVELQDTMKVGQKLVQEVKTEAFEVETEVVQGAETFVATVRRFKAKKLDELEEALAQVPDDIAGFKGYTLALVDKEVKLLEVNSKQEALDLIHKARTGILSLIF